MSELRACYLTTFESVGLSASVEGKIAARVKVKKQELADSTFTIPASVLANAACNREVQKIFFSLMNGPPVPLGCVIRAFFWGTKLISRILGY